jgi:hypothetical protein
VGNDNDDDNIFFTSKCNKKVGKPKHQKKRKIKLNHDLVSGAKFGEEGGADEDNVVKGDGGATTAPKSNNLTEVKD